MVTKINGITIIIANKINKINEKKKKHAIFVYLIQSNNDLHVEERTAIYSTISIEKSN
jgi:hypothetical protein